MNKFFVYKKDTDNDKDWEVHKNGCIMNFNS